MKITEDERRYIIEPFTEEDDRFFRELLRRLGPHVWDSEHEVDIAERWRITEGSLPSREDVKGILAEDPARRPNPA